MWMDDYSDDSERQAEVVDWGKHIDTNKTDVNQNPSAAYNKLSEALRQSFPHEATCSMFCGGKKCKYCCPVTWKEDEQAIKGLYSHWVTDNILAMSRPITEYIEKYRIIDQFKTAGIKAIINVQLPGEHAACGNGVHNNEFSYRQQDFMDSEIFFYNFGWKDFGVAESMSSLLDMVKVMQFAISEGKVAIHCHAGKGRTGVLIGCFLVFHNRMSANEAVHYIRSRRPNSVQTGPQVKCIQDFEKFLIPYRVIFSLSSEQASFNLTQFLTRQKAVLHGYQARKLKFLPKIIYVLCERLLNLAKRKALLHIPSEAEIRGEVDTSLEVDPILNPNLPEHRAHKSNNGIHGTGAVTEEVEHVGKSLAVENWSEEVKEKITNYQRSLNDDDRVYDQLRNETDAIVLGALIWEWLDHLKDPLIRMQDMANLFESVEQPQLALQRLEKGVRTTITYLMEFLVRLQPIEEDLECEILQKLVGALTHKSISTEQPVESISSQDLRQSVSSLTEMKDPEKLGLFRFFYNLLEVVEDGMAAGGK